MLIKIAHPYPIKPSEITSESIYRDRRRFLLRMGLLMTGLGVAGCGRSGSNQVDLGEAAQSGLADLSFTKRTNMAGGENLTAYDDITHYNNYYEFGARKTDPSRTQVCFAHDPGQCWSRVNARRRASWILTS